MLIHAGAGFWLLALFFWVAGHIFIAAGAGSVAFGLLGFFFKQQQELMMFGRRKAELSDNTCPAPSEEQTGTIIAEGVHIEGSLRVTEQAYIYGDVRGDVTADGDGGHIYVMRNGSIRGDICCEKLVVNGVVMGHCQAGHINIDEHGYVDGSLTYHCLSITPGGIFTGTARAPSASPLSPADEASDERDHSTDMPE